MIEVRSVDRFVEPYRKCPFCRETVVVGIYGASAQVLLNPQKRLIIFDRQYKSVEDLTDDTIEGYEELNGKFVIGRTAIKEEVEEYKNTGKISKPWTIIRMSHWIDCDQWIWLPKIAAKKKTELAR